MTDPNNPNLSAPSGSDMDEGVVERLYDVCLWVHSVVRPSSSNPKRERIEEAIRNALRSTPSPTLTPDAEGQPTFTLAVTMLPNGTDVQVDFQRDPKRWTEVRDAILVGIERLQGMIAEQAGCPARPKSDAEEERVRAWYRKHAYTIAAARKMTKEEEADDGR